MNYKLIALDMDGTLLRKDKTVSERTKKAITVVVLRRCTKRLEQWQMLQLMQKNIPKHWA